MAERTLRTPQGLITESVVRNSWGKNDSIPELANTVALVLDAQGRLGVSLDGSTFNPRNQPAGTPAQYLFQSRHLEREMSTVMQRAFGEALTVDRYAGSEIHLLVGQVQAEETKQPQSDAYLAELSSLSRLSEQGDGIRAFMGILLTIVTSKYRLILIDEPEAFLHPPQARLLGRILAEQHASETQVIVATHSEDIVQGITSAAPPDKYNPAIVRLNRSRTTFTIAQIPVDQVRQLYHDPLVRYSRVLSGLFISGSGGL